MRLAEPHGRAVWLKNMEPNEYPGDDAIDGIENPLPSDGAERNWRYPRQKNQEADKSAAAEVPFESGGECHRADDHNDLRADSENDGVFHRRAKTGALHDAAEVF